MKISDYAGQILSSFSMDMLPWMKLWLTISVPRLSCRTNSGRIPPHWHRSNLAKLPLWGKFWHPYIGIIRQF